MENINRVCISQDRPVSKDKYSYWVYVFNVKGYLKTGLKETNGIRTTEKQTKELNKLFREFRRITKFKCYVTFKQAGVVSHRSVSYVCDKDKCLPGMLPKAFEIMREINSILEQVSTVNILTSN